MDQLTREIKAFVTNGLWQEKRGEWVHADHCFQMAWNRALHIPRGNEKLKAWLYKKSSAIWAKIGK